jgi:hypothetical protein
MDASPEFPIHFLKIYISLSAAWLALPSSSPALPMCVATMTTSP